MKKRIECVMLDAGGVLVYPRAGNWRLSTRWDELWGGALDGFSAASVNAAIDAAARKYLDESAFMSGEDDEFLCRREYFVEIARLLGAELSAARADALARDMTENDARYGFYDDARAGVTALGERFRLCLLSDAMPSLKRVLANAGFMELLDGCVISTRVGAIKPDPKMYAAACALMEVAPENCAFADDKIENLMGAERAGMTAIHISRADESEWRGLVARNLFELLRLLS